MEARRRRPSNAIVFVLGITGLSGCAMFGAVGDAELESQNQARLEKLKSLEGRWEGTSRHGEKEEPMVVTYKVTAGGSSVVETIGPGTEHEMVTLYTLDRGDLVLTHYCMLGNQPRMVARKGGRADQIQFDFAGCGNLTSPADPHMHDATLTFAGDDRLSAEWTMYRDAKAVEKAMFDLKRVGS